MLRSALALSLLASLLAGPAVAEPRLELLGVLPEHEAEDFWERGWSFAGAVSADGCTIVGSSQSGVDYRTQAVRWTEGVIEALPLAPDVHTGVASDVSADGSVIVGWETDGKVMPDLHRIVVWEDGERIDAIADGYEAHLSAAGDVLVYNVIDDLYDFADRTASFRREGGIDEDLGVLPGGSLPTIAEDVSADGSVIVGAGKAADGEFEAFRWENGALSPLGRLPGQPYSWAHAVSADGATIVGKSGDRAFRWKDGVLTDLGPAGEQVEAGGAMSVSADGSTVVGAGHFSSKPTIHFVWTEEEGRRTLEEFVTNDLGLDPVIGPFSGFGVTVSPDARVIVGSKSSASFMIEAYALWLDDSGCMPDGDGDGVSDASDNCPEVVNVSQADADGDGYGDACDAPAEIDVKPWRARNFIDLASQQPLAVALLGSQDVDVTQVEISTLSFGPDGAPPLNDLGTPLARFLYLRDVNHDDLVDLLLYFEPAETGLQPGDTEACLDGGGEPPFHACDDVTVGVFGCGLGFEIALALPPLLWLRSRRRRARRA